MFFARLSSKWRASASRSLRLEEPENLRELARRAVARDIVDFHTMVAVEGIGAFEARLMDISPYGCQIRARSRMIERSERIWVSLPDLGEVEAESMWGLKGLFGCKFLEPIEAETYAGLLPQLQGAHPDLSEETDEA